MKCTYGIACFATLFISAMAYSQKVFSFGPEMALPARYRQSYNNMGTGVGGSIRLESPWSKHVSGMVTAGYLIFGEKHPYPTDPAYTEQLNILIIQAGIKYYIEAKTDMAKGIFLSTEIGAMPSTNNISFTNGSKEKFKEGGLSIALGTGYQLKNLDASFRLQYNLTVRGLHVYYYNFRLAYAIPWQKKN